MTLESEILKRLESVKKDINESKKVEPVDEMINSSAKNRGDKIIKNGRITYAPPRVASRILLVFDATGSMSHLWDSTRQIMNEMVKRITDVGNVKLKCIAYRDYCDGPYIFEKSEWHSEANPLINFIMGIKCAGGGDTPEAVEDALKLAHDEKEMVTRVILIGDAPPHSIEKAGVQAVNLKKAGRPVFAFRVGNDDNAREAFQHIAKLSDGAYGDLRDYNDLLDMISITIVHDVGGSAEVNKYLKKYDTSAYVKTYSQSLPSYKK